MQASSSSPLPHLLPYCKRQRQGWEKEGGGTRLILPPFPAQLTKCQVGGAEAGIKAHLLILSQLTASYPSQLPPSCHPRVIFRGSQADGTLNWESTPLFSFLFSFSSLPPFPSPAFDVESSGQLSIKLQQLLNRLKHQLSHEIQLNPGLISTLPLH